MEKQTILKQQKAELEDVLFSGMVSASEFVELKREIKRISKRITPTKLITPLWGTI